MSTTAIPVRGKSELFWFFFSPYDWLYFFIFFLFHFSIFFFLTDDRAVFFQTFQHVFVRHGVRHARQRQYYGTRARVHQQHRHVTDPERRLQRPFQVLRVGERHVTSVVRQAHRPKLIPQLGVLDGVDHFVHLHHSRALCNRII